MRTAGIQWLAMAVLAVLSLGITVFVAQRALTDATDVVVRGESDVLMSVVAADLADDVTSPPTSADLERVLAGHAGSGLGYVALLERDGRMIAEAGTPEMRDVVPRPGQPSIVGRRVRVGGPLFARRPRTGLEHPPSGRRPPLLLVLEFEPPVFETLRADLRRIAVVAAAAGVILLAFAVAWSRSAARLAAIERRAAREQRLVALGGMSSVMAHELRNPLASLKGHAQLLVEDLEEAPKQRAKAERVVREAERLELLTTSLLDFVRDGPIERTSVAPSQLVDRSLEDLSADRVQRDLASAPDRLLVDEARLSRALHNVVDNALQASDGKPVELRIAKDGRDVVIEIRDHGPGIPAGAEAQIFEPFHTTRVRGTGLGLAVARRIAEQHGGSLTGENHPDGGALFRLRFTNETS